MALAGSALSRPVFWILLFVFGLLLFVLARRLNLRWWPAWGLRVALVCLILVGLFSQWADLTPGELPQRQVMVVDQSDSLAETTRQQIREQAKAWQSAEENRLLVAYGSRPYIIPRPVDTWPAVEGRASNLEAALDLTGDLLGRSPGEVLLASDGVVLTTSGVENAINRLARAGHTLHVYPLPPRQDPNDGYVGPLRAPTNLWAGTPFDVVFPVVSPRDAGQVNLKLKINGQESGIAAEPLQADHYRFRVPPQAEGIITLEVQAEFFQSSVNPDTFPGNNSAFTTLQVFAAPRVLFVTPQATSGEAGGFVQRLAQNNLQVDVIPPSQIPTGIEALESYRVIFLHDLLSNQLQQEQMQSLQIFVSRLAGGLVFLGGRNSYTLGGYSNTLLEPMLPVKLEPPPRSQRPPIVFLLVLDRSGSMGTGARDLPKPIALAREAAMRAIEAMKPEDYLGVLTFSDDYAWNVPFRKLDSALGIREALDSVSGVQATGGTYMYEAMQAALAGIRALPADAPPSRHILLLSDGASHDGSLEEFQALARFIRDQNITISTIALGEEADEQVMEQIAEAGKGRFYAVSQPDDLPRILIYESQAARSENVQAGQTSLRLGEADHPLLSGMSTGMLPLLSGYNALSSKSNEGAEDILVSSNFGDPILSAWQYGLGRVVVWATDIGEEWLGDWPSGSDAGTFWSQVVRYALVNPGLGNAQVNVQVEDTQLVVETAILDASGDPLNLSQVNFVYVDSDGQARQVVVPQVSAGAYRTEIPLPEPGAYRAVLAYGSENEEKIEVPAPFAVNPPPEWLPADLPSGQANLAAWASMAGGQVLSPAAFDELDREPVVALSSGSVPWWRWLLLALVLIWPLEIALRRRWLPWM